MLRFKIVNFVGFIVAISSIIFGLLFRSMQIKSNLTLYIFLIFYFLITFFIITFLLKKHIYGRIRTLYKLIYSSGMITEMNDHTSFDEVEEKIKEWGREKQPIIQQLKAQEKYRKEFIGDVAHELKTPIFNIQGYILTLADGGLYDEKINKKYLRKAQKNIDRMILMVEDLDLISKLESGELKPLKKAFNISEMIKEAMEEVEMSAIDKDIRIRFEEPKETLWAYAERSQILQVTINLIINSIKYGKEGGKTIIRIENNPMKNKYCISIEDNGIGIDTEDLPRIFERFYRVDKSRSRKQGGSGLGLSIVKHTLEVHEEKISVESQLGKGTIFKFTLQKANVNKK